MTAPRFRWLTLLSLAVLLSLVGTPAWAQFKMRTLPVYSSGVNPNLPFYNPINPLYQVAPGLTQQQALVTSRVNINYLASIPPWLYWNPYPQVVNTGPVMPYPNPYNYPYGNPYFRPYPYMNPYYNPYYSLYRTPYANPYMPTTMPLDPTNPYSSGQSSAYDASMQNSAANSGDQYGGYLRGVADLTRAQGKATIDMQSAYMMAEQNRQAQLDTRKKQFDLEKYMRENMPSLTEQQAANAYARLKRLQSNTSPSEVASGHSLNLLIDDLRKHPESTLVMTPIPLEEEILRKLNVTTPNGGNFSLLRNEGHLQWPTALVQLTTERQRQDVDVNAEQLYKQAANGKPNPSLIRDLSVGIEALRTRLIDRVNQVPTGQYIDGKRFLNSFDEALRALQTNSAVQHFAFQKWVQGGKSVQQLATYMVKNGLVVAPATIGDENAYLAIHTYLVSYALAVNAQAASAQK